MAHVEDARANGATVTTGGHHEGLFYAPTVLSGVTPDMVIAREETFGPVAPIIKISSAEEALTIANDSPYGLSMSVFTSDLATAFDMAEGLEAGAVNVNSSTNDWELNGPFGGWKKSGIGRELGVFCMREFSNVKTITFDLADTERRGSDDEPIVRSEAGRMAATRSARQSTGRQPSMPHFLAAASSDAVWKTISSR